MSAKFFLIKNSLNIKVQAYRLYFIIINNKFTQQKRYISFLYMRHIITWFGHQSAIQVACLQQE